MNAMNNIRGIKPEFAREQIHTLGTYVEDSRRPQTTTELAKKLVGVPLAISTLAHSFVTRNDGLSPEYSRIMTKHRSFPYRPEVRLDIWAGNYAHNYGPRMELGNPNNWLGMLSICLPTEDDLVEYAKVEDGQSSDRSRYACKLPGETADEQHRPFDSWGKFPEDQIIYDDVARKLSGILLADFKQCNPKIVSGDFEFVPKKSLEPCLIVSPAE